MPECLLKEEAHEGNVFQWVVRLEKARVTSWCVYVCGWVGANGGRMGG